MRFSPMAPSITPVEDMIRLDAALRGVVQTLVYFDMFDYPLTARELFLYHPDPNISRSVLEGRLAAPATLSVLGHEKGYYFLRGRAHLAGQRALAEQKAQPLLHMARIAMHRIKKLPFVRGIYLSGDLSKGVAGESSDLDFFIITAAHRVWLCKLMLALFRRMPRCNPHRLLCFNYLLDESAMELAEKNEYTAFETAALYPLWNIELLKRFFHDNEWVRRYIPRYDQSADQVSVEPYLHYKAIRAAEGLVFGPVGFALNLVLKAVWRLYWRIKFGADRETRDRLLAGSQSLFSKSHGYPTAQIVLQQYHLRLAAWGLTSRDESSDRRYYHTVAAYYDQESERFEEHYRNNRILQRLRDDFRRITEQYPFQSCLEIGYGPGLDLRYFAEKYPDRCVRGIDVSSGMWRQACANLQHLAAADVRADIGTPEELSRLYPDQRFDLIYCYYGALNTVTDLDVVAGRLRHHLSDQGVMVLTFVNRWYLFDMVWNLLRLRWRKSVARLQPEWPGYAPQRPLASRCRSSREIKRAFQPWFTLVERKGYSILYPAWFRHRFIDGSSYLGRLLWRIDQLFNKTVFWNCGEYSLYVFRPR